MGVKRTIVRRDIKAKAFQSNVTAPKRPQSAHPHRWWIESSGGTQGAYIYVVDECHAWWEDPTFRSPERFKGISGGIGVRDTAEWLRDAWEERRKGMR